MKEEYKSIIDSNGNMICNCVLFIEDIPQCFVINEEYKSVDFCMGNFVKPKWNGQEWIESATEEEIEAWKEENKPIENIGENLIDKLILDNINMQSQIDSLIQAQLGGN
ncbi:hypothetical protein [Clostridium butyricum]|uniref:Uncharacterized protein n=1 Tax=Clostridium butyricum E4 str. BoNT E BL5262 TaxID=632245 RepID=C4IJK8_CLOBU|nr:hypothetical protein [Clostridium butyricum]APF22314.1 hypothetical protein NPD4_1290 [Clostridium butyricum]EDT74794.1 hypothetical protein CBY_2535 [Clostridium butyricum 5521]EEP54185.1 hypothetical protein CLP_2598 [Clostridium butyricum E4 str. BoNT E BL5262]NFL33400.1 hypothetical protein [Clostridium butyricum]NFS20481.1 hypothetical protein [Clostridium butyricum]